MANVFKMLFVEMSFDIQPKTKHSTLHDSTHLKKRQRCGIILSLYGNGFGEKSSANSRRQKLTFTIEI